MKLLYVTASCPSKKLVHYSSVEDAPWLWYETPDASRVSALGGHGTDLFGVHPELPNILVHWFVTSLIKTPGHAPADALASDLILNQLQKPGATAQVTQLLTEARQKDASRVSALGGHGTDLFGVHPELPNILVHWFVTTLIKTPGHAPADALASDLILNQLQKPGATAQVTQLLTEARQKDA